MHHDGIKCYATHLFSAEIHCDAKWYFELYTKVHGFILVDERNIGPLAMPIQNVQ